jgi:hypothetical protein
MIRFRKSQEGLIIAGFALTTVMIIALLVTFLSNRVGDMITMQNQAFFSKQAYWNAYSGMELGNSYKIASLDGVPSASVSFTTGTISITQTTAVNEYLGGNKVSTFTSTGSDAGGRSRAMKLTIGNPSSAEYGLFFDGTLNDYVEINNIQDEMAMEVGGAPEALRYVTGEELADWTVSFWVRPDFTTMQATVGGGNSATRCWVFGVTEANGAKKAQGIQIGIRTENGNANEGYLEFRYDAIKNVNADFAENSASTQMTHNNWYHVVYKRTVTDGFGYAYINGVYQGKHADPSGFEADDIWYIGTNIENGPTQSNNLAGCMDEVAVWKTALSEAQIQTLYIQGKSFDISTNMNTNLVSYWDFDNTDDDQSGNSNTANIAGATYTGF